MKMRYVLAMLFGFLCIHHAALAAPAADDADSGSFDAKGVKLHYIVEGKGEPVILIHGLLANAEWNWKLPGVFAALAKDHHVIGIDMPGHGKSDKPEDPAAYGRQMAEDVVVLMDHLKIPKAHIVGYSMGGMVAMKLLATHPDRIISCIVGGMGWMKEGQKIKLPAPAGSGAIALCIRGFSELAITEDQLKAIKVPAEILIGEKDLLKHVFVEPLQEVRKDWPVVEIKDAGHITCIMKAQFREEIVKWVGAHTGK